MSSYDVTLINYQGRPLLVLGENALVVPMKDQGKDRVLIMNRKTGAGGVFLDTALNEGKLTVMQELESEKPVDLCAAHKNLPFSEGEGAGDLRSIFITRVLHDDKDSIRICFTNSMDVVPTIVASRDWAEFNTLDVGNLLIGWQGYTRNCAAKDGLSPYDVRGALPGTVAAIGKSEGKYHDALLNIRGTYIQQFLDKKLATMFLSIFVVEGKSLKYGAITIEVNEKLKEVLEMLSDGLARASDGEAARNEAFDFERLLPRIAETSGDITVNGVPVRYAKKTTVTSRESKSGPVEVGLQYVNGKRIANDDADEVLNRVACYQGRPDAYQEFVDQVGAISLKFHRANVSGVPITSAALGKIGRAISQDLTDRVTGNKEHSSRLPNDFSTNENAVISARSIPLPFRKNTSAQKGEVEICGAWRKVDDFDRLVQACAGAQPARLAHRLGYHSVVLAGRARDEVFTLLFNIDRALVAGDQIVQHHVSPADGSRYRGRQLLEGHDKAVIQLTDTFLSQFQVDVTKQVDAIARSRELFERVMKQEKVVVQQAGTEQETYVVTGKSGRRYAIERSGAVTDLATGGHVCIVNGGGRDLGGFDYLTSLVAALASDTMVAQAIRTLPIAKQAE